MLNYKMYYKTTIVFVINDALFHSQQLNNNKISVNL